MIQRYLGAATVVALMLLVVTRAILMRRGGTRAFNFGKIDRKDFLIPPFALFYFYLLIADAFGLPLPSGWRLYDSPLVSWIGVGFCLAAIVLMTAALASFGRSFRVGIDTERPDRLVTTGVFALTRNPIYVAFAGVLLGELLVFPNWILFLYLAAGVWLFHRQVLREEGFLLAHYGQDYAEYCKRVRRYL